MKLSFRSKSFFNSTSNGSFGHQRSSLQKGKLKISIDQQEAFVSKSSSDYCLQGYFKMFPQQKRKHNVSLFNFFTNKFQKKTKQIRNEDTQQRANQQNGSFIIKKIKQGFPCLSAQKLKVLPHDSHSKIQKIQINTQNQEIIKNSAKQNKGADINKINDSKPKTTKFDRKKYMYYRYRKKSSPQKNDASDCKLQKSDQQNKTKLYKKPLSTLNTKADIQTEGVQQKTSLGNPTFKYSFYGVFPTKNKSLTEMKCKLTIQPMPRRQSYKLIDRQSLSRTTRQLNKNKRQLEKSGTKLFAQAIHFKRRKKNFAKQENHPNPQIKNNVKKQQQILGWHEPQQCHGEQLYF